MKKYIIGIGAVSIMGLGIGGTLAFQSMIPTPREILESELAIANKDLHFYNEQIKVFKEKRNEKSDQVKKKTCLLAHAKLAEGIEIQEATEKMCGFLK